MSPHRRAATLIVAVSLAAAAASCNTSRDTTRNAAPTAAPTVTDTSEAPATTPSSAPATGSPAPTKTPALPESRRVDQANPDAVCQAFTAALFTIDTATGDTSWGHAGERAAAYATAALAKELKSGPRRGNAQWTTWINHRAHTTTTTTPGDEHPPDAATTARRSWSATYTPRGRDNWTGPPETAVIYCTLTKSEGGWHVASYDQQ